MPIIHKISVCGEDKDEISINIFGIPIFKHTIIRNDIEERKPCGFAICQFDAPSETIDDEETENCNLEPYATV